MARVRRMGGAAAVLILALVWALAFLPAPETGAGGRDPVRAKVVSVIDADTLAVKIMGKRELVRMVGLDAPEMSHSKGLTRRAGRMGRSPREEARLGRMAREAVTRLVAKGDWVTLEGDAIQPWRDKYGRILAYVGLKGGRMLNGEVIAGGWALAFRGWDYREKARFLLLEKQARRDVRGLWGKGGP